jgi:hypothetical protein
MLDETQPVSSHLAANKAFAESFDRRKRREEMQKAKERTRELEIDLEQVRRNPALHRKMGAAQWQGRRQFFQLFTLIKRKDPR